MIRKLTPQQKDSIRNLIRAVRQSPTTVEEHPDLRELDWNIPTRYVGESLEALRDFAVKASRVFADNVSELLGATIKFGEPEISQFYGAETRRIVAESNDYIVPLSLDDEREVGVIILPSPAAVSWVQKLLGGLLKVNEDDLQRDLSHLESEILLECVDCILTALNGFFDADGEALSRARSVRRKYEIAADKADTYCMIKLPDKQPDGYNSILLLLPGQVLDTPAGLQEKSQKRRGGPSDAEKMLQHVRTVPVDARACLDQVELPMRLVMSLEPGDVLLTDKRVNQPIELCADEVPYTIGYPVRSEFDYGLLIAAPEEATPPHVGPDESKNEQAGPDRDQEGRMVSEAEGEAEMPDAPQPEPEDDAGMPEIDL